MISDVKSDVMIRFNSFFNYVMRRVSNHARIVITKLKLEINQVCHSSIRKRIFLFSFFVLVFLNR
jgi:hypothetical protein